MNSLDNIERLVSAKISVVKNLFSLIKLEARLAGLSVFPLILNLCMLVIVLSTVWLSAMMMLGFAANLLIHNVLLSLFLILALNIIFLVILLNYFSYHLNNLSFPNTRNYFSQTETNEYEQLEETSSSPDCSHQRADQMRAEQSDTL